MVRPCKSQGIETRPVFYPAHHMPMYQQHLRLPVARIDRRAGHVAAQLSRPDRAGCGSCFWVYAYPALLRYAAHYRAGTGRGFPHAREIAS